MISCQNTESISGYLKINAKLFFEKADLIALKKLKELNLISSVSPSISLVFFEKDAMQKLNFEFRAVDAPTDVLSFPMWEDESGNFVPPSDWDELPLGDIVVCPEIVEKNAEDNRKIFLEELALVIFHGILHLVGFDHDTEEKKEVMWHYQNAMTAELVSLIPEE